MLGLSRGNDDFDIVTETIRKEMQGAVEMAGYIWHALRLIELLSRT